MSLIEQMILVAAGTFLDEADLDREYVGGRWVQGDPERFTQKRLDAAYDVFLGRRITWTSGNKGFRFRIFKFS